MRAYSSILLKEEDFYLLPQKAMFRPSKKQLIISDIHLGKATHFRKQGIALPPESHSKDLERLKQLIDTWKPCSILILGDLFHSKYNKEWEGFRELVNSHPGIQFILVEGNHDILDKTHYELPNLFVTEQIEETHFIFTHKPLTASAKINFSGHIHPGIKISGRAKQSAKFPCFYFNGSNFILPAFGYLTGLYLIDIEDQAEYYIVSEQRVIKL